MKHFRPTGDRVVVARDKSDERSTGGIYIPETSKDKPIQGVVLAIGPGRTLPSGVHLPMTVKVGDSVIFDKHNNQEVTIGGEEVVIVSELAIIGIVEK